MTEDDPLPSMAELVERVEQLEIDVKWLAAEFQYWRELHEDDAEPDRQPP